MKPIGKYGVSKLSVLLEKVWYYSTSTARRRDALMMGAGLMGLRCCEVLRVRRKDVVIEGELLRVRTAKKGRRRTIGMGKSWLCGARLLMLDDREASGEDLLFRTKYRTPVRYEQILRRCREWTKKATGEVYTFHCLRHSFAVSMYEKGMDVLEISRALGHKSLQWTSVYLATIVPCETAGGMAFTREDGVKPPLRIFNPREEVG
jgi:integrase